MHSHGVEFKRQRHKFRCPIADNCGVCDTPCSDSTYCRVVYTVLKDNPRLFTIPPRNSKQWTLEYNSRTSVERNFKRLKDDYKFELGSHLSSKMWYIRLYSTMMLQHLDAWNIYSDSDFISLVA